MRFGSRVNFVKKTIRPEQSLQGLSHNREIPLQLSALHQSLRKDNFHAINTNPVASG
jgi:hypothetical protein